jgi:hypothetical protein
VYGSCLQKMREVHLGWMRKTCSSGYGFSSSGKEMYVPALTAETKECMTISDAEEFD